MRICLRATLPIQDSDATTLASDQHASSTSVSNTTMNNSPRRHSSVDEIFGLVNSMSINGQRQRSLSDSGRCEKNNINGM